jgi:hypothetical protein
VFELTASEEVALIALRKRALEKAWATAKDFEPVASAQYRTKSGLVITLDAEIDEVAGVLSKALKPHRKLLTAMRFTDGRVEETHAVGEKPTEEKPAPEKPAVAAAPIVVAPVPPPVAVTVAAPTLGCPMPAFPEADIRASRVLEAFLSPEQTYDYRRGGSFVATGADTGHRYLVANRETEQALRQCSGRQLFDLDEQRALCVHDWDVPPAEEMLAIMLCLELPFRERLIRSLPETWH